MKPNFQSKLLLSALLSAGLVSVAMGQATYTVGTAGGDFADLATAMGSVSGGDTLILDPANNDSNPFAVATITVGVTIQGQNGAVVGGGNWFFDTSADVNAPVEVTVSGVTVTGAGGANGIVVNGAGTVLNVVDTTVTDRPNFGINVNTGTLNVSGATVISNNGGAGISVGGSDQTVVNIIGTEATPIQIIGNGHSQVNEVQRAGISTREITDSTRTLEWNLEHVVISGSPFGYTNFPTSVIEETVNFNNVDITGVSLSAIKLRGNNVIFNYDGGTISGRTDPDGDVMDNLNIPLVHVFQDGAGVGTTFVGNNLTFSGGDTPARLRNDSNPMVITNSTLNGGTDILGVIFAGGGAVTFEECTFVPAGRPIIQGAGGANPITIVDPTFSGTVPGIAFFMQGHVGEFTIEGSDAENKASLDGMASVAILVRNWAGTTTFRNVTATGANGGLFDAAGLNALAGPVIVNVEDSVFTGTGGRIDTRASLQADPATGVASNHPVIVNATNTIWTGSYSPYAAVISVWDDQNSEGATVNLTHCTLAPSQTEALVINGIEPKDTINSYYSIIDASGAAALLGSGVTLNGDTNNIYSIGGATDNGGWPNNEASNTIIANPQLAGNGELTPVSPAVDAASGSTTPLDYKGTTRPQRTVADIGAHESEFFTASIAALPAYTNQTSIEGVELTLDEAVALVEAGDFVTDGVTVSSITGAGTTRTLDLTLTGGDGPKTLQLNAGALTSDEGNLNLASNQVSTILDTVAPVTTISSDVSSSQTTQVTLTFSASDENGVVSTSLLVREPGEAGFVDSGLTPSGNTFVYTATASGLHEFSAVSTDVAGNVEGQGAGNTVSAFVNIQENGPVEQQVGAGSDVVVSFPLTSSINVVITFDSVTEAGAVEITRVVGDGNAETLGLNPDRLAGQYFIITAVGGLEFSNATIVFELDDTLLGSELADFDGIDTVFVNRGGTLETISGASVEVDSDANTVTVSGVNSFSEWYFGDSTSDVADWILLMD